MPAGKDQGVHHGYQPAGIKLWLCFVTSFFNALILTIVLAVDAIAIIYSQYSKESLKLIIDLIID